MTYPADCNCPQAIRLALELATERDKLARIATLVRERDANSTYTDDLGVECCTQIAEILAEAPGERP